MEHLSALKETYLAHSAADVWMFLPVAETIVGLHYCGAGIVSVFSFQSLELRHWVITFSVTLGNIFFFASFHLTLSLLPLG